MKRAIFSPTAQSPARQGSWPSSDGKYQDGAYVETAKCDQIKNVFYERQSLVLSDGSRCFMPLQSKCHQIRNLACYAQKGMYFAYFLDASGSYSFMCPACIVSDIILDAVALLCCSIPKRWRRLAFVMYSRVTYFRHV